MKLLIFAYDKFEFLWVRSESVKTYELMAQTIALCCLIKLMPLYPLYKMTYLSESIFAVAAFVLSFSLFFRNYTRTAAAILAGFFILCWHQVIFENQAGVFYTHHVQLLIVMLIALSLFGPKQDGIVKGSGFSLIRFIAILIYLGGIWTKLEPSFLSGHQIKMIFIEHYWGSDWLPEVWDAYFKVAAYGAIFTEALILVLLLRSRTRLIAFYLGAIFHLVLFLTLPVSIFSILMIGALYLFTPMSFQAVLKSSTAGSETQVKGSRIPKFRD